MSDMRTELDRALRRGSDDATTTLDLTVDTLRLLLADVWEEGYRTHRGPVWSAQANLHNPYRVEVEA